jgi:hypothetical protein
VPFGGQILRIRSLDLGGGLAWFADMIVLLGKLGLATLSGLLILALL